MSPKRRALPMLVRSRKLRLIDFISVSDYFRIIYYHKGWLGSPSTTASLTGRGEPRMGGDECQASATVVSWQQRRTVVAQGH